VSDISRALHFYRDLLGLEVITDLIEEGEFIDNLVGLTGARLETYKLAAPNDEFVIELMEVTSHPNQAGNPRFDDIGTSHIAFEVDDIDRLYTSLSENGVRFCGEAASSPFDPAKSVFALDPDGTMVQFVEFEVEGYFYNKER
jgi:catechol 2,3-dioxygenase-like lactoylglutathione lyase family enzyme